MRCLHRSLALRWLLRRQGIYADLRIGVRKDGEGLVGAGVAGGHRTADQQACPERVEGKTRIWDR